MGTIVISVDGGPYKTYVEQGTTPGPVPPAPPAPGPTPPPAPPSGGSLVPRPSLPNSEVMSSPRNSYTSAQPVVPFVLRPGLLGQYNTIHGKNAGMQFANLPFIIDDAYQGTPWFDWTNASDGTPVPVFVAISRVPDDWQGQQGMQVPMRAAMSGGSVEYLPGGKGLFYYVFKYQTPGTGDILVSIRG